MDISTLTQDSFTLIRLKGRFDFRTRIDFDDGLTTSLANAHAKTIQIDLGAVDYMDSAALGMLLTARENAKALGKTVSLTGPKGTVKQVLDIANFGKLFAIA